MSITRLELQNYLDGMLRVSEISDYCPNGLQVEGASKIEKIVTGVTASQALVDAAIEAKADALIVHHGYFWKGESQVIAGMKKRRLQALLSNDINLFAYHLPLDVHPPMETLRLIPVTPAILKRQMFSGLRIRPQSLQMSQPSKSLIGPSTLRMEQETMHPRRLQSTAMAISMLRNLP